MNGKMVPAHLCAVVVNHNTSRYTELLLRSYYAHHSSSLPVSFMVLDNDSIDTGLADLRSYTGSRGIPLIQSGFKIQSKNNSHGEILRRFVLDHSDCSHYLFLDADAVFLEDDTIDAMFSELDQHPDAFGIMPTLSSNGHDPVPLNIENPDIYAARIHPCCALIKNTPLFRVVVDEIGLSCVKTLWAERDEYLDTFKLMTKVMHTHGLKHLISPKMILHFFSVSYDWEPESVLRMKDHYRDQLLDELRKKQS